MTLIWKHYFIFFQKFIVFHVNYGMTLDFYYSQNLFSATGQHKQMKTIFQLKYSTLGLKPFFFKHLLKVGPRRRDDGIPNNMILLLLEKEMFSVLRGPS